MTAPLPDQSVSSAPLVTSKGVPARLAPTGGLLQTGNPGNKGGKGRPPDKLRERLRNTVARRVRVIREIADGEPNQRVQVAVGSLLGYLHCKSCGEAVALAEGVDGKAEITVKISASPKDRIAALDFAAKYGVGTTDTLTVVSEDVSTRLRSTIEAVQSRSTWNSEELLDQLEAIWA